MPVPLEERVNRFVAWLFREHNRIIPRGPKVINDSLLGNQYFSKHEVAVIDCPLLQRLKRIKQTGLVYHVFPSATHSRFEHCLGATTVAERCFHAISDRARVELGKRVADEDRVTGDLAHLRMAALLHDVGHGLCSHASEQIYALLSDLREFKRKPDFARKAPGEILSYLIVKSSTFENWFHDCVNSRCGGGIKLDTVAEMILGKHPEKDKHFLAQIVSSPYDADKLDYIARDSYYCGLALTVDLPRFYSMISVADLNGYRALVLRSYVPLEQILFSKMMLFGVVYHHQKVKCLDSMLRSVIQHIGENPDRCTIQLPGASVSFSEPVEYLYVTDDEFFNQIQGLGDAYVQQMLSRLRRRKLFVRCLQISRRTVVNWNDYGRAKLMDLGDQPAKLDDVERKMYEQLPSCARSVLNPRDVRLSIPDRPQIKTEDAVVQTSPGAEAEPIERFFPVGQWTDAYAHNKWSSYVYGPREQAHAVRDAAISVLAEEVGLEIDPAESDRACHVP